MAGGTNAVRAIPLLSGEDLTGDLYKFAVINGSGRIAVNTTAQGVVDGVVNEEVDAAGKESSLALLDGAIVYIKLGATLAAGALVASGTDGRAVAHGSTAGDRAYGKLIEGGVAGDIVRMQGGLKDIDPGT